MFCVVNDQTLDSICLLETGDRLTQILAVDPAQRLVESPTKIVDVSGLSVQDFCRVSGRITRITYTISGL